MEMVRLWRSSLNRIKNKRLGGYFGIPSSLNAAQATSHAAGDVGCAQQKTAEMPSGVYTTELASCCMLCDFLVSGFLPYPYRPSCTSS